ncbi:MAG: dephospho-CoA kinase [Betaproteobacteria bacterium]|nr:dephospho-CoA kinase [Betaproteobacteria bacterium]
MTFVVGLTGGIGCGKSMVSEFFSELGVDIIDTDVISRELTQPKGVAISPIQDVFGDDFVTIEGALDRSRMRSLVFSDSSSRFKLEKILHPLIINETIHRIAAVKSLYSIVVVPLLFETKDYDDIIQRVLVVDCDEQKQIERTVARSKLSDRQVREIMATQVPRQVRLTKANDIITNNLDIGNLKKQVISLHNKYLEFCGA